MGEGRSAVLKSVTQVFVAENSSMPWHTQYSFGGDILHLQSANGITSASVSKLAHQPFSPIVAIGGSVLYLWPENTEEDSTEVALSEGASVILRPEFKAYLYCFECHSGEITFRLQKLSI